MYSICQTSGNLSVSGLAGGWRTVLKARVIKLGLIGAISFLLAFPTITLWPR
jgi:hypothetical protein